LFPLNIDAVNNNLPLNYTSEKTDFIDTGNISLVLTSSGFAVFAPDYIGFTNSKDKEHPYVYYPELFNAIIGGIHAVKSFIKEQGYPEDKRVFLAGWSQGAGAAISANKYLEENYFNEFTVVASSGLAGPYNFSRFMNFVFENKKDAF